MTHTATPWTLVRRTGNSFPYVIVFPDGSDNFLDHNWSEADAAHIVKAVNAIDHLVAALQAARDELTTYHRYEDDTVMIMDIDRALAKAGRP